MRDIEPNCVEAVCVTQRRFYKEFLLAPEFLGEMLNLPSPSALCEIEFMTQGLYLRAQLKLCRICERRDCQTSIGLPFNEITSR